MLNREAYASNGAVGGSGGEELWFNGKSPAQQDSGWIAIYLNVMRGKVETQASTKTLSYGYLLRERKKGTSNKITP